MELIELKDLSDRIKEQIGRVVLGQENAIEMMAIALLCEGHILLEGVPGTAKTLLARSFATCLSLEFKRIQFTPDLMPGDILGTNLFDFRSSEFNLTKGPIFTQLLLADEINRTPPKTQAALLQAMQEHSVTIDRETHSLGEFFTVLATQNPIEQQGIYPLPEAQLDRFVFKVIIDYPEREQELEMVRRHGHRTSMPRLSEFGMEPLADTTWIEQARKVIPQINLADDVFEYIVDIIRATRDHSAFLCGASPRSTNMLAAASRACAALQGRDYVIPDDVKGMALPVLRHRLPMSAAAEIEGLTPDPVIGQLVDQVAAPR